MGILTFPKTTPCPVQLLLCRIFTDNYGSEEEENKCFSVKRFVFMGVGHGENEERVKTPVVFHSHKSSAINTQQNVTYKLQYKTFLWLQMCYFKPAGFAVQTVWGTEGVKNI